MLGWFFWCRCRPLHRNKHSEAIWRRESWVRSWQRPWQFNMSKLSTRWGQSMLPPLWAASLKLKKYPSRHWVRHLYVAAPHFVAVSTTVVMKQAGQTRRYRGGEREGGRPSHAGQMSMISASSARAKGYTIPSLQEREPDRISSSICLENRLMVSVL